MTSENLSGDTILTNKVSKTQMTKIRISIKSFPIFRRVRSSNAILSELVKLNTFVGFNKKIKKTGVALEDQS